MMRLPSTSRRRPGAAVAAAILAIAAAGCGDREVVARAGKTVVTREEYALFHAKRGGEPGERARALEALGARALLAEAARRDDLADLPEVAARLASARREILAQAYLDKAVAGAVDEKALRARYDAEKDALTVRRAHPAHIVVLFGKGDEESRRRARARATQAHARILGGAPFEKVARELSDDQVSAAKGGALGPVDEGQVDARFFAVAVALREGEVSEPVESAYGWHVVKALAAAETIVPPFERVRGRLAAELRREAEQRLDAELRERIGLKVFPERVPAGDGRSAGGGERR
jgi:hypothetical protein